MANLKHLEKLKEGVEAWNMWRKENPDERPDLQKAFLREVNMVEANLSRAGLLYSDMVGAKIARADLRGAWLGEANLLGADLHGADLREASLMFANLFAADMAFTQLNNATFGFTNVGSVDLSKAIGLEDVKHLGPSIIGIDTFEKSKGKIPLRFLQSSDVSDKFIKHLGSFSEEPIQYYSCFISYSHTDKAFAYQLHAKLQDTGIRCWLDEHELLPGDDQLSEIDKGIQIWDKLLLCCSEASLKDSWWVDKEIDKALQKEEMLFKKTGKKTLVLIPLDLDGYVHKGWESEKKSFVKARHIADFIGWEADNAKFEKESDKLIRALHVGETGRRPPPESLL